MELKTQHKFEEIDKFLFYEGNNKDRLIESYLFLLAWKGFEPQLLTNTKCKECETPVKLITRQSKTYGYFGFVPSRCDFCKNKANVEHLKFEAKSTYQASTTKCGGLRNREVYHQGEAINFDSIKAGYKTQDILLDLIHAVASGQRQKGFLVSGGTGVGKTFLTKCLHNELVDQLQPSVYIKAADLAIKLRTAYREDLTELIKDFKKVKHLFIDDYGIQKNTEMVKELFFSILEYRYENNLQTYITTNLDKEELDMSDSRLSSRFFSKSWLDCYGVIGSDLRIIY